MQFDPSRQPMHPHDKKNLIIFVVLSLLIWWSFDHFVLAPRFAANEAAQKVVAEQAPETKTDEIATDTIRPREDVLSETKRINIDGPEIIGSIPLTGNRFDDISLKNFYVDLKDSKPVALLSPAESEYPLYTESGWLSNDSNIAVPDKNTAWKVKGNNTLTPNTPVTLTWDNGQGLSFEKHIKIDDHFLITVTQNVTNNGVKSIDLYPYSTITRRGVPSDHGKGTGYEGPVGYIGDELHEVSYDTLSEEGNKNFNALNGWIGFGEKYWLSAIMPEQLKNTTFNFQTTINAEDAKNNIYQVDARGDKITVEPQKTAKNVTNFFVGAKKIKLLDAYEDQLNIKHLDMAIDFGLLYFLTKPLYFLLITFHNWVGNFGVAIIMLTFVVRGAVFPLANKSYRSFAGLRKIAPKMADIKVRYGNDKPRLQQELVKLYETEKVNPMAGCLPILLQMPIFFAIYRVMTIAVEMRHAPFFGWIEDLSMRDPLSIFNLCGLIPIDLPSFLMIGPWSMAMFAMMMFQKKLNPPPQDQIQKDIANFMPYVMTFTLASFPSGLVIYWAFSNLLSVIQQSVIMKMMGVPIYLFSPDEALAHNEAHQQAAQEATEKAKKEVEAEKAKAKRGEGEAPSDK